MKGFKNKDNILITNRKFGCFDYSEEAVEINENFFNEFVYLEVSALQFRHSLEFLKKCGIKSAEFKSVGNYLKITSLMGKIKIEDYTGNPHNECSSRYNIEYLIKWIKKFSVNELKEKVIRVWLEENTYPIKIQFKEDWLILAPRIENE